MVVATKARQFPTKQESKNSTTMLPRTTVIYYSQQVKDQYKISPYVFKTIVLNLRAVTDNEKRVTSVVKALQIARASAFYTQPVWLWVESLSKNGLKNQKLCDFLKCFLWLSRAPAWKLHGARKLLFLC